MTKIKIDKKKERDLLIREGLKHRKDLTHEEYICPICGGIASIGTLKNITTIECHACGIRYIGSVIDDKYIYYNSDSSINYIRN